MRSLAIEGIGTWALGLDAPGQSGLGRFEAIPINEVAKPAQRRRFGRLTKLVYVAASRAVQDAQVADLDGFGIVLATAMGEIGVSLDLLRQIHQSKGALIRPSLVPNAVHNSPSGHLAIGFGNHQPSITVSQGWLSEFAAVAAAIDLGASGQVSRVLLIAGDESDPTWVDDLRAAGGETLSAALERQQLQEGAVALVLDATSNGAGRKGSLVADSVRLELSEASLLNWLAEHGVEIGPTTEIRVHRSAGGEQLREPLAAALKRPVATVHLDGSDPESLNCGVLAALVKRIGDPSASDVVFFGQEIDELAFLQWKRGL